MKMTLFETFVHDLLHKIRVTSAATESNYCVWCIYQTILPRSNTCGAAHPSTSVQQLARYANHQNMGDTRVHSLLARFASSEQPELSLAGNTLSKQLCTHWSESHPNEDNHGFSLGVEAGRL